MSRDVEQVTIAEVLREAERQGIDTTMPSREVPGAVKAGYRALGMMRELLKHDPEEVAEVQLREGDTKAEVKYAEQVRDWMDRYARSLQGGDKLRRVK